MIQKIVDLALRQRFLILAIGALLLAWGAISFYNLPIEAYPDVAPQWVQVIAQWPGHAPEEIEKQITLPIETHMNGIRNMTNIRSHTMFGLAVISMTFSGHSNDQWNREQVLERLSDVTLPNGVTPQIGPDYSPVGQIYWYTLRSTNPKYDPMELKALQDWVINRRMKSVPGVVGDSSFGGMTREYQVRLDPDKLTEYGLSIGDVEQSLKENNYNAGGGFIEHGQQMFDVRVIGMMQNTTDIANTVLKQVNGTPVHVSDVGRVVEGHVVRLGRIGETVRKSGGTIVDNNDVVEGIVLLQKGAPTEATLKGIEKEVKYLNAHVLPKGVKIVPYLDRSTLIHFTTHTVLTNLTIGFLLVTVILFIFLGNARSAFIVAGTIPFSLLFAATCLNTRHIPANLLSLGALDFGMVVDGTVMMVENIFRVLCHDDGKKLTKFELIGFAAHEIQRPVFFAVIIIIVAYLPIFALPGVSGLLFTPMAWTVSFALLGALIFALIVAPVLSSFLFKPGMREWHNPVLVYLETQYAKGLSWCLQHRRAVLWSSGGLFLVMVLLGMSGVIGSEFLPHLDEGAIWVRGMLPMSTGPTMGAEVAHKTRLILASFPETTMVVSQDGRPDDGTSASGFFNTQYYVGLKPQSEWPMPYRSSKALLIEAMDKKLKEEIPYAGWNFSQPIQDNVDEAVSGVRGENGVKVFGPDLKVLAEKAKEVQAALNTVPGVVDTGIYHVMGQPNVNITVSRSLASRYGISVSAIRQAVEGAVGGKVVSQILRGDERFPLSVRYEKQDRTSVQAIASIRILSPSGARVSLGQLCHISIQEGPSTIFRNNNERFIPIKFGVRGRDLGSTVKQAMQVVQSKVKLPQGYHFVWAGEYTSEQQADHRLDEIIPIAIIGIALLLYFAFNSFKWVFIILLDVALAPLGGLLALLVTHTYFSVSSGVGLLALFGVSIQIGMIMLEYINQLRSRGHSIEEAALEAARVRLRPILMTMLVATLGLLPAAMSHAIGSDAQRPFAIVIVGGLTLTLVISLFLLPTLYVVLAGPNDKLPMEEEDPVEQHA
ncbi:MULTISPECIES: CusA/CzcA family heavy metal efflux RND transporter [Acidobacterium]|uniref:Heavy metal efflux pump, CzcA family n=1 Tax=Acidobacterium capsulatum (strain ATCC 51196 / DSM 11244 / BCRC 80197 / JCM 7670 / NBRC 15755 / NCIMB 13165 / 161) TaxID=240015 RepID=C1F6K0_ACIC5|nr:MULTISPECIES: CusA/CzcA family heavy metal efflux RND transporter [Acidobacterium]ACO33212.1 heavy metal efflux pump, CzcA family [Acidobacterium capsulatum ATCC 51196]HCT60888.1 CusA/CzcA family heavy metal efflux RND transporter [Acidobacterium sp.]